MRIPYPLLPLAAIGLSALATSAIAQGLAVLGAITPGEYRLREIGSRAAPRAICVRDADQLLQVRHARGGCSRFTVSDGPRAATVSYTCAGRQGRTTLRVESESIVHVATQGIAGGAPFDVEYEARRTGPCTSAG